MSSMARTTTLSGLPGTRGDREAVRITSRTAAIRALRAGSAATAAGPQGAVNVWRDDQRAYRAEFLRYLRTVDSQTFYRTGPVAKWLDVWLPKTQEWRR